MITEWIITVKNVPVYDQFVEVNMEDAERSDLVVEINGDYVHYSGSVSTEVNLTIDEVEVDLTQYNWSDSELQDLCNHFHYEPEADLSNKFSSELVDELIRRGMSRKDTLRIIERLAAASSTVVINDE